MNGLYLRPKTDAADMQDLRSTVKFRIRRLGREQFWIELLAGTARSNSPILTDVLIVTKDGWVFTN
ncbi:MAG: hypothetical protein CMI18_09185 [Opitutaceae bacterium]|nr:hypothetical protein [Opitutaceae bacterium]